MTANRGGLSAPSNRSRHVMRSGIALRRGLVLFALSMCAAVAYSSPPYDILVTFNPPLSGGAPDGYNFYVDDCAVSGPVGAPVGTVTSGQAFVGLIAVDGTYQMCVRAFNAAGENPDPGPVATVDIADLPLPGPVENLDITVACPNGGCTVTVTISP